jgi:hypothetical protein
VLLAGLHQYFKDIELRIEVIQAFSNSGSFIFLEMCSCSVLPLISILMVLRIVNPSVLIERREPCCQAVQAVPWYANLTAPKAGEREAGTDSTLTGGSSLVPSVDEVHNNPGQDILFFWLAFSDKQGHGYQCIIRYSLETIGAVKHAILFEKPEKKGCAYTFVPIYK